ncbi:MAG: hypothetical protein CMM25_00915 [Rhodospirillaceae bacterium]|nr:hypothetical protein [Rhodospirillaceae bacterium]|tara:strand:- start:134 stop:1198 length:1065 start_codon:yes stop_codon:yes gene_type:complete
MMKYNLRQHGRATLDFLSSFGSVIGPLMQKQNKILSSANLDDSNLSDDLDTRSQQIESVLSKSNSFRTTNLVGEWHAEHHAPSAAAAFAEIREELQKQFTSLKTGNTKLTRNSLLKIPKYWRYPIHRTTGGWDGHPHMGFIHGELIHRYVVGKSMKPPAAGNLKTDIYADRKNFAEQAPRRDYKNIMEIGCSSGPYTAKLSEVFPQATIAACDISIAQLEQAQRNGNTLNKSWKLFQADGRQTNANDESYDLFTSYILLHEMPVEAITELIKEGYRVLKSGGDLLFGDVAPYSALDKVSAWRTDYMARYGGEPFWRGSSTIDIVAIMEKVGFVDIKYYGMKPHNYPWVSYGRKP